jgi:peptide-methionine (R)-S-oxide reductase
MMNRVNFTPYRKMSNALIKYSSLLFVLILILLCNSISDANKTNPKPQNTTSMNWNEVMRICREGNPPPDRRVEKSDIEWRNLLTAEDYRITRLRGTEMAFSGEYCERIDPGLYACKCCGTELFDSGQKFDSGSGWPSFTEPLKNNVIKYEQDNSHGMVRVEVSCNVCDAHLGHVFPDGPEPTGLRYCINSKSIQKVNHGK